MKSKSVKKRTEEQKRKMSIAHVGKKHSDNAKEKCRIAAKKRIITDELRIKLGIANSGKKHSEQTKLKLSEIVKKWWENKKNNEKSSNSKPTE